MVGETADHPSTVTGLAFNPKGKRLAVSHYGGVTLRLDGEARSGSREARMARLAYRYHLEPGWHDGADRHAGARTARLAAHQPPDDEHGRLPCKGQSDGLAEAADDSCHLGR